ncbi:MAG: flavodoxin [Acidobacteriota bacterium]
MKAVIAWGSCTGYTEEIARDLFKELQGVVEECVDIADASFDSLLKYDVLICGTPTWDYGELQQDWEDRLDEIARADLRNKAVAFFGCGDADGYPDFFQDGMGILWSHIEPQGATLLGRWSTEGYQFSASQALDKDGKHFVGLAIDEHSQHRLTDTRLKAWVRLLKAQINQWSAGLQRQPEPQTGVLAGG